MRPRAALTAPRPGTALSPAMRIGWGEADVDACLPNLALSSSWSWRCRDLSTPRPATACPRSSARRCLRRPGDPAEGRPLADVRRRSADQRRLDRRGPRPRRWPARGGGERGRQFCNGASGTRFSLVSKRADGSWRNMLASRAWAEFLQGRARTAGRTFPSAARVLLPGHALERRRIRVRPQRIRRQALHPVTGARRNEKGRPGGGLCCAAVRSEPGDAARFHEPAAPVAIVEARDHHVLAVRGACRNWPLPT